MRGVVALLALALGSASCLDGSPVVGAPAERCDSNADCTNATCDATTHRCVSSAREEVFFTIAPASGHAGVDAYPTLVRSRSIVAGESVNLALHAPRTVYGVVTAPAAADDAGVSYVPATLEFTPSDFAGVSPPVQAVAGGALVTAPEMSTWSATLTEGLYDVFVRPASTLAGVVPPRFERGFEVRSGDALMQRFDLSYPTTYARWEGAVHTGAGDAVPGFVVRAIDPTQNYRVLSTVSTTAADNDNDGDGGHFACSMAPGGPDEWTLRLSADNGAGGSVMVDVPRAALAASSPSGRDVRVVLPQVDGLSYAAASRPPLSGPCVGCVDVSATVEGVDAQGVTRALRGATVTLHTSLTAPTGLAGATAWFEARTTTDADGNLRAWLVPGDYDVVVTPTGDVFRSAVQHGFRVRADALQQSGQVFSLVPRPTLSGRVLGRDGLAVSGARVTAVPYHDAAPTNPCLDMPDLRALTDRATPVESVTANDGSYEVDVSPGLYRLLVEPVESSGFPVTLALPICVASSVRNFDTTLEAPVQVQGVVSDAVGNPSSGATVEALVRLREGDAPGVVLRVARATADDHGAYRLLIPVSAAGAQ